MVFIISDKKGHCFENDEMTLLSENDPKFSQVFNFFKTT